LESVFRLLCLDVVSLTLTIFYRAGERVDSALEAMSDNIAVLRARAQPQAPALFDQLSDAMK
jgi:hypothetical protein